jgi:hypothetical protein
MFRASKLAFQNKPLMAPREASFIEQNSTLLDGTLTVASMCKCASDMKQIACNIFGHKRYVRPLCWLSVRQDDRKKSRLRNASDQPEFWYFEFYLPRRYCGSSHPHMAQS